MRIRAFKALRPRPELAARVACVPYDVVSADEARALAAGNPLSFLHVARSEIDLPAGTDPYAEAVYAKAAENLARLKSERALIEEAEPSLYVYRQTLGRHVQRGVVACCAAAEYEGGIIRRHEKIREEKRRDRFRHISRLGTQTGLVFLVYRDRAEIDALMTEVEQGGPALVDFVSEDDTQHAVWRVELPAALTAAFERVPICYIADGHHRAAASADVAKARAAANPHHTGEEEYNGFAAALFPASQVRILPYNRCVQDLNRRAPAAFLDAVRKAFEVFEPAPPMPRAAREISMYVAGRWYGLRWASPPPGGAASGLDVSVLQNRLLDPILGVKDPRADRRIEFVGGIRGPEELKRRVDSGAAGVAFSMFPVRVDEVMAIADAGETMPPKSTWFEPKLRSGLLMHGF